MADQFQPGGCTGADGTSWWTTAAAATSCSTDLINWPPPPPAASSHDHSPPPSISSSTFIRSSSRVSAAPPPPPGAPSALMEMDLGLSSPSIEWTQPFFTSGGSGGGGGSSFQSLLQDELISRPFLQDHGHFLSSGVNGGGGGSIHLLPAASSGGLLPSSLLQGLYSNSEASQVSSGKLPAPRKQPLQFANDAPFWSPSSASGAMDARHERRPPQLAQNEASSYSDLIVKTMEKTTATTTTSGGGGEPETKKPRLGTPTPFPTFKVRKEKLGDRITALQQLVSPFGKTDTASVLHEATEYIKFLHDQVRALSAPYLKNGHDQSNLEKSKDISEGGEVEDLSSRGLCLVPIPSTLAAANEIPTDFWSPPAFIGSSFR